MNTLNIKKTSLCVFALFQFAMSGFCQGWVFHGQNSGDLLDVNNWYQTSGTPDIWDKAFNNKKSWTFDAATTLPGVSDTAGIGRYFYGDEEKKPNDMLFVGKSYTFGKMVMDSGYTFNVGSETDTGEFKLRFDRYEAGSYMGCNANIFVNLDSMSSKHVLSMGFAYLTVDTHIWGAKYGTAFDKIEVDENLFFVYGIVELFIYAKSVTIGGTLDFNVEANTTDANTMTLIVPDKALTADTPYFEIGGDLKKFDGGGAKLLFDFEQVEIDIGEYILMRVAGNVAGFGEDKLQGIGLINSPGDYNLFWRDNGLGGNDLVLNVVPEPATIAAIFGSFALALAAWRRRRNK